MDNQLQRVDEHPHGEKRSTAKNEHQEEKPDESDQDVRKDERRVNIVSLRVLDLSH